MVIEKILGLPRSIQVLKGPTLYLNLEKVDDGLCMSYQMHCPHDFPVPWQRDKSSWYLFPVFFTNDEQCLNAIVKIKQALEKRKEFFEPYEQQSPAEGA